MTEEEISAKLDSLCTEVEIIKKDIEDLKLIKNNTSVQVSKLSKKEMLTTIGFCIFIIIFMIFLVKTFEKIDTKLDNIGTPVGTVRGGQFTPFPPDSKVVRWPDDFYNKDTIK
jgi:hypothetical protein